MTFTPNNLKELEEATRDIFEIHEDKHKQLLDRIKKGKRWLTTNRLEWLQAKVLEKSYDFKRWTANLELYYELYNQAYKLGLVDLYQFALLHPWGISDLIPTLKQIFPSDRFDK